MYDKWRKPALQAELRNRDLEASGTRDELIARLEGDDQARQAEVAQATPPPAEPQAERRKKLMNGVLRTAGTIALVVITAVFVVGLIWLMTRSTPEPIAGREVDLEPLEGRVTDLAAKFEDGFEKLAGSIQQLAAEVREERVSGSVAQTAQQVAVSASWPESSAQAAALFGGTDDRWEITPDGGWHLREESYRTLLNPSGYALEGYYDMNPGKDPRQFVSVASIEVQGATIWDATPEELFCAMIGQKFSGLKYDLVRDQIDAVGFSKPTSCP